MPLLKLETSNNSHYIQGNRSLTSHFVSLSCGCHVTGIFICLSEKYSCNIRQYNLSDQYSIRGNFTLVAAF